MLAFYAANQGSIPKSYQILEKHWYMLFLCLGFSTLGKSMVAKYSATSWPAPTVAFAVLAKRCGLNAGATEMDTALFTEDGEGRT